VAVESEQAYLQPGDTLSGAVRAHYLFGLPVTQAAVRVEAKVGGQVVAAVDATTDAEGAARYTLAVPAQAGGAAAEEGDDPHAGGQGDRRGRAGRVLAG
jgi:hypothetical protein